MIKNILGTALWVALSFSGQMVLAMKLVPPSSGVYHGAFPDYPLDARYVWDRNINSFEILVEKALVWSYFANDWTEEGIEFPMEAANAVFKTGKIPFIRILPRSSRGEARGADPIYSIDRILKGDFDGALRRWAQRAREFKAPLLVEFAPEVNGRWYPWNGFWNGGGTTTAYGDPALADGPEKYRDASRRVIGLMKEEQADNITWFFHVDSQPKPEAPWNKMAAYYPGDQYIDWIGVSVFGAQYPWDYWDEFTTLLDFVYPELTAISTSKPIAVVEFGVIEDLNTAGRKANWIYGALKSLMNGRYPRVKAISYWHENSWIPTGDNNLRLDSSYQTLNMYRRLISEVFFRTDAKFGELFNARARLATIVD